MITWITVALGKANKVCQIVKETFKGLTILKILVLFVFSILFSGCLRYLTEAIFLLFSLCKTDKGHIFYFLMFRKGYDRLYNS